MAEKFYSKNLEFNVFSGHNFPENLTDYKLIVHCGGFMITRKVVQTRIQARFANVPIVNYGLLISFLQGTIPRAIKPFSEAFAT